MGEIQNLTFADQVIVDSNLTNINYKSSYNNSPFEFALDSSIKNYINESNDDLENTGSYLRSSQDDFESSLALKNYPPYHVTKDLKYLKNYSKTLQSWKGTVTTLEEDYFIAELEDLSRGGTKEIAQIEMFSVSPDDIKLVQKGASFYWNIGYKMNNGQITKESLIRFQRIIDWDSDDFDDAADRAADLFGNLNID